MSRVDELFTDKKFCGSVLRRNFPSEVHAVGTDVVEPERVHVDGATPKSRKINRPTADGGVTGIQDILEGR